MSFIHRHRAPSLWTGRSYPGDGAVIDANAPLGGGLLGFWPLAGSPREAASGINAALVGAPAAAYSALGPSYLFDGSGKCLDTRQDDKFNFRTAPFSFSLWINTVSAGLIIAVGKLSGGDYWIGVNGGTFTFSGNGNALTAGTVNNGVWRHLVATRNGASRAMYVDGVLAASGAAFPADTNTAGINLAVGAFTPAGLYSFDGSIAAVSCYSRTLSAIEVQQLYLQPFGMFRARLAARQGQSVTFVALSGRLGGRGGARVSVSAAAAVTARAGGGGRARATTSAAAVLSGRIGGRAAARASIAASAALAGRMRGGSSLRGTLTDSSALTPPPLPFDPPRVPALPIGSIVPLVASAPRIIAIRPPAGPLIVPAPKSQP